MKLNEAEKKSLENISNSIDGENFKSVLSKAIDELSDIANIGSVRGEENLARAVMARRAAIVLLQELFNKMKILKFKEKKITKKEYI